jgi:hypothetical protein
MTSESMNLLLSETDFKDTTKLKELMTELNKVVEEESSYSTLKSQINELDNLRKTYYEDGKKLSQSYFNFNVEKNKEETGLIVKEWEQRKVLMDNLVSDSKQRMSTINKNVGDYLFNSFNNFMVRNNKKLNDTLDIFKNNVEDIAGALYNNGSDFVKSQEFNDYLSRIKVNIYELRGEQERINKSTDLFVTAWLNAGNQISDIIDMLPDFSKQLYSSISEAFTETNYIDRFNKIGSAFSDIISKKLIEDVFNKSMSTMFMEMNNNITTMLQSGNLTIDNMLSARTDIEKATVRMEAEAYRTKGMLDILKLDNNIEYTAQNEQISYSTGTSSTQVYNQTFNVQLDLGTLVASREDRLEFAYDMAEDIRTALKEKLSVNI